MRRHGQRTATPQSNAQPAALALRLSQRGQPSLQGVLETSAVASVARATRFQIEDENHYSDDDASLQIILRMYEANTQQQLLCVLGKGNEFEPGSEHGIHGSFTAKTWR